MARRGNTGITNFLSDIADDIKDFLDDEVLDRGRDAEHDLRRAGRNLTDERENGYRSRRGRGNGYRDDHRDGDRRGGRDSEEELAELRDAIRTLSRKVDQLADDGPSSNTTRATAAR